MTECLVTAREGRVQTITEKSHEELKEVLGLDSRQHMDVTDVTEVEISIHELENNSDMIEKIVLNKMCLSVALIAHCITGKIIQKS